MLRFSRMIELGTPLPPFRLPDGQGIFHSSDALSPGAPVLVIFICNHCPFVHHIVDKFVELVGEFQPRGLQVVAISSNDTDAFPEDGPDRMVDFGRQHGFGFPYLYDESQAVALAYGAICTPDIFLFDAAHRLAYRGQFDQSRPAINRPPMPGAPPMRTDLPVSGADLRVALEAVVAGQPAPAEQRASAGCSIKWKPDNEPDWG
jgi:peroxiredoxin